MERWRKDLIGRIIQEDGRILGPHGLAIRLQQELGMSWEEATAISGYEDNPRPAKVSTFWVDSLSPEIPLETEHRKQSYMLALMFAKELGMSKEEYMRVLPPFPDKPKASKYLGLRPLIVEGRRFSGIKQAQFAGLSIYLPQNYSGTVIDCDKDPQGFITPETPYATWVSIGYLTPAIDLVYFLMYLAPEYRGATISEGIAYATAYPNITEHAKHVLFPGSGLASSNTPFYLDNQTRGNSSLKPYDPARIPSCYVLFASRDIRT